MNDQGASDAARPDRCEHGVHGADCFKCHPADSAERDEMGWNKEANEHANSAVPMNDEWPADLKQTITRRFMHAITADSFQAGWDAALAGGVESREVYRVLEELTGMLVREGVVMSKKYGPILEEARRVLSRHAGGRDEL